MVSENTRRAVLGMAVGGGVAVSGIPQVRRLLRLFAPLSGGVWDAAQRDLGGTFASPYGEATVRRDEYGVAHVDAANERTLAFAVGYVHGIERLFQMDLFRRQMRGELSAVVGESTVESDEFHRRMDFTAAAEATVDEMAGTEAEPIVAAYCQGVNLARRREDRSIGFELLEYEPDPWTPTDAMLIEKQIAWGLTGSFEPLRLGVVEDEFGDDVRERLFPDRMDHDWPILRERELSNGSRELPDAAPNASAGSQADGSSKAHSAGDLTPTGPSGSGGHRVGAELAAFCSGFTWPSGVGSNSWVVGGEHTADGNPIVCNDPHLPLTAPPVWYEQHLECPAFQARGVAFPGAPFVVIGENHAGAWGFTNVGADVCDHYTYETDGDRYRYGDEWREFDTETVEIEVANGSNETIERRKTVHGPVVEEAGQEVAVSWTGLAGTRTFEAIRKLAHSEGIEDAIDALRRFDAPTQNVVYADRDGRTLYWTTGKIPIRRTDGEIVRGDRIFDGSAQEGEWEGFEPYGSPSWEGFVPFADKPGLVDPDYVATANQRVIDEPGFYLGVEFATPFRGARAYERLDAAASDGGIDRETMRDVQQDIVDRRARLLVPAVGEIRDRLDGDAAAVAEDLLAWDMRTTTESRGALAFDRILEAFREIVFEEPFEARDALEDLDDTPIPNDWILLTLPADDPWFAREDVPARQEALVEAVERAAEEIADAGDETYGDVNRLAIQHLTEVGFLAYPTRSAEGAEATLKNVRVDSDVGSSWRMIAPPSGDSIGVIPGGNSGDYFSEHYHDQLSMWLRGEYKPMGFEHGGSVLARFRGGEGQ